MTTDMSRFVVISFRSFLIDDLLLERWQE